MANTQTIKDSLSKVTKEAASLQPSTVITLFEIDISEIKENNISGTVLPINDDVVRFHNMDVIAKRTITFNSLEYFSIPIQTDGFELSSSGQVARPKLSITAVEGMDDEGVAQLASLKRAFISLGNLVGAKVTRIRTFAKFLDASNNIEGIGQNPDAYAEFPRETFFINSKIREDKFGVQFELSSVIDTENFKLPGRFVLANRCPWTYRGEGCCYEFKASTTEGLAKQKETFGSTDHLPSSAPPIANTNNELIADEISPEYDPNVVSYSTGNIPSEYDSAATYMLGKVVFVVKNNIKYYFVSKGHHLNKYEAVPAGKAPPNSMYWEPDQCGKTIQACKLRWGATGAAKKSDGTQANSLLPFGGFPGTNSRVSQT